MQRQSRKDPSTGKSDPTVKMEEELEVRDGANEMIRTASHCEPVVPFPSLLPNHFFCSVLCKHVCTCPQMATCRRRPGERAATPTTDIRSSASTQIDSVHGSWLSAEQ